MTTEQLREKIRIARDDYWKLGISSITDEEYDKLVEELHRRTGEYDPVCGPEVLSSGKVRHPQDHPMLSMQKVYSLEEVEKWMDRMGGRVIFHVMPKYDGIALRRYANRVIATRGNGLVGENVTEVASDFVESSHPPHDTFVDGEAVCTRFVFDKLAKLGYKNPRNAVSGILSSKDRAIRERAILLTFVPYSKHVWSLRFDEIHPALRQKHLGELVESIKKQMAEYPMDGIVFRVAHSRLFQKLGHTDHHWRGQIALKFKGETAESYVEHIEWRVKNGTVTPVAVISPVNLDGAEITNVTLHNADYVAAHDIRVGDRIVVERAGGVIPSVVEVKHSEYRCKLFIPETCPVCRSGLLRDGARLYCPVCEAREKGAAK